jgi:hypothetical protein
MTDEDWLAREIVRDVLRSPDAGLLPTLDGRERRLFWRVYRSILFENMAAEFGASRSLARFTLVAVRRARALVDTVGAVATVHPAGTIH